MASPFRGDGPTVNRHPRESLSLLKERPTQTSSFARWYRFSLMLLAAKRFNDS